RVGDEPHHDRGDDHRPWNAGEVPAPELDDASDTENEPGQAGNRSEPELVPLLAAALEVAVVLRLEAGLVHQLVVQRRLHGWSSSFWIHERKCSPTKITAATSQPTAASRASRNFAASAKNVAPATIPAK